MLNGLDLFSGIGGMSLALRKWVRPIAYCEIDPYCQGVLLSRMADESLSNGPIWDDIKTLDGNIFKGAIDIIYGGFPCQDISIAGHGKGLEGERSGLFFEIVRILRETRPRFLFLENVPAITTRGGIQIVKEITSLGYDCRWCVISASSVGAIHRRERWFLLAHSHSISGDTNGQPGKQANTISESKQAEGRTWRGFTGQHWPFESVEHWQKIVSEMGKCSDGILFQSHRLRALGNAVVPQQAKKAFKILMGLE